MMDFLELFGALLALVGSVFFFLSALGILRMPDIYTRIQAGTKATTLGSLLFLLGIGISDLVLLPKVILLICFIVVTNPISSHALARASHYVKIKISEKTLIDSLEEDRLHLKKDESHG